MCVVVDIKHSYDVLIYGFLLGSLDFDWLRAPSKDSMAKVVLTSAELKSLGLYLFF